MIKAIEALVNFGSFLSYKRDTSVQEFKKINIFYGNNGSGKTTLCNLLYLTSKHCKDADILEKEYIRADTEIAVTTTGAKINHKNITSQKQDLYIFNSKFISDHVYDGTRTNMDSFSSESQLTSEELKKLDARLHTLIVRKKTLDDCRANLSATLQNTHDNYNAIFGKKISDARLTKPKLSDIQTSIVDIDALEAKLDKLYVEHTNKKNEEAIRMKFDGIKSSVQTSIRTVSATIASLEERLKSPLKVDLQSFVKQKIDMLQQRIEEKQLQSTIGDLSQWYRTGGRLLVVEKDIDCKCPLCDTLLKDKIDDLIADYTSYFSNQMVVLQELLDRSISEYEQFIADDAISINSSAIDLLITDCLSHNIAISKPEYNLTGVTIGDFKIVLENLRAKKKDPSTEINIDLGVAKRIASYFEMISNFSTALSQEVDKAVNQLGNRTTAKIVDEIKSTIGKLVIAKFDSTTLPNQRRSNLKARDCIVFFEPVIDTELDAVKIARQREIANLNTESKFVNIYLTKLGISHFVVNRDMTKSEDNLSITYFSGISKNNIKHALSESEKTALALAYFISKIQVEKIEGGSSLYENCIVVIDDPVSSLDDDRLFQTANLLHSFLFINDEAQNKHPEQVFILSHNLVFLKYITTALKSDGSTKDQISEYFIHCNDPRIRPIPNGLKHYSSTYIIKFKEIVNYSDSTDGSTYDKVKNYLPNHIRIVLETFLSFKLAYVNVTDRDMMPGLSNLIARMTKEMNNYEDITLDGLTKSTIINKLNALKKIADHESHGNIAKLESPAFIEESELKKFAKDAIAVIKYLDKTHYKSAKTNA